ncbi:MAG TPA: response regulator transcription factor [bacterium]|nr:response regulator transcription factor [bacterium]
MVRVVVIAEDPALRHRLRELLAEHPDYPVIGEGDVEEAAVERAADVIVWDLGRDPVDLRRQIAAIPAGDIPLLLIGPGAGMADALAAGARGYLAVEPDGRRLAAALQAVAHGLLVTDPAAAETPEADEFTAVETLTAREHDVLQLLAEGLANKEIARRLHISDHTVKFHVNAILGKLGARTRTEAVTRAARQGLITL